MEEKYCLKEDTRLNPFALNHPAVKQTAKELSDKGVSVFAHGMCLVLPDKTPRTGDYVTGGAFRETCVMLNNERNEKNRLKKKFKRGILLSSLLCVVLAVFSIWSFASYKSAETQIVKLNEDKTALLAEVQELNTDKSGLLTEVKELTEYNKRVDRKFAEYKERVDDEYNFFHERAVIVTTAGEKYHEYGCYHIRNRSFYIFNTENAIHKGYTPCLDCIGK